MKFQKYIKGFLVAGAMSSMLFTSCISDLDVEPIDPNLSTGDKIYTDLYSYEQGLAKIYAGLALSGQKGPAGDPDLVGLDEGASQYLRKYWEFQELPTDEAINGWTDPGQPDLSQMTWSTTNVLVEILYYRMTYQVTLANQFLRDTDDVTFEKEEDNKRLGEMRAEARFLRALSYWHALDFFGNGIPFTDENSSIGSVAPAPPVGGFEGREIFDFIESELKEITADGVEQLKDAKTGFIGQVEKGAAYMLLAKLYMNAEIYTGEARWADAKTVLETVLGLGYSLEKKYQNNFLADNYLSTEIIFAISYDGQTSKTYGGTSFIIHGAVGGDMNAGDYGIDSGWGGQRSTTALVDKFDDNQGNIVDTRALFYSGHNKENTKLEDFKDGSAVVKFSNKTRLGYDGRDPNLSFVDTNFPLFRLADAYLMLAEIEYRQSGTVSNTEHLEAIWDRAGLSDELKAQYKAELAENAEQFLLDERARELYWEGHRKTDLVRFGQLTSGAYIWPWKGGKLEGTSVSEKYNFLPIPASEVNANPNLEQHPLWR